MDCLPMMSAVVSPRDAGDSAGFTVTVLCERSTWSLWAFSSEASLLHTCESGSAWDTDRRVTELEHVTHIVELTMRRSHNSKWSPKHCLLPRPHGKRIKSQHFLAAETLITTVPSLIPRPVWFFKRAWEWGYLPSFPGQAPLPPWGLETRLDRACAMLLCNKCSNAVLEQVDFTVTLWTVYLYTFPLHRTLSVKDSLPGVRTVLESLKESL